MNIAIGCDHSALEHKAFVINLLESKGHRIRDFGCYQAVSCDYPSIAEPVSRAVADGSHERAILICGTGLGMSYAANKVKGIRAACCSDPVSARLAREHNDAQILCFGARIVGLETAKSLVETFIDTPFSGDPRHQRRIDMIAAIESSLQGTDSLVK